MNHLWIASVLTILTTVLAGCAGSGVAQPTAAPASPPAVTTPVPTTTNTTTPPQLGSGANLETTLQSVYESTNPSVVNIRAIQAGGSLGRSSATGSGFVWDSQGNIVTNNHVIAGASRITITFWDGSIIEGKVVGTDADSDLAVVKVTGNPVQLRPVTMGDSIKLKVGQLAIAIGNPFGLQGTMTTGIVSGLGRLLPTNESGIGPSYRIPDVVQTDAAINPGNSGGVLLDSAGRVIGVTSSIATTTGTNAGVGFAIPSAIVQQIVPALIRMGRYEHPYLGISIASLDPDLAVAMGLPANQRGALVQTVTAGGPADKAGLQGSNSRVPVNGVQTPVGGDVVIGYDEHLVKSSDDLITFLARYGSVGQTATLTLLRGGRQVQVQVTLGPRPTS